jgi:hypothetical protein
VGEMPAERTAAVVDESESHADILACSHPFQRSLRLTLWSLVVVQLEQPAHRTVS